jgi:hypothetical protein
VLPVLPPELDFDDEPHAAATRTNVSATTSVRSMDVRL